MSTDPISPSPEEFREALKENAPIPAPVETVPEQKTETPAPEKPIVEAIPEPPVEPAKPVRKYLPKAFGIKFGPLEAEVFIQGTFYHTGNNNVDIEGNYGNTPYSSIEELIKIAMFTNEQRDKFLERTRDILKQSNR